MIAAISYPPIPILDVGPIQLSLHGLFAALGFVVGAMILLREVRQRGFDADKVASVLTWALVGSILGARLFTVPAHIGEAGYGWDDVIGVAGDFSILGGFAGGILVGLLRGKLLGLGMLPVLDMAAPGLAVGAVIGRIGDLAIVEHLGGPTSFFLGYELKPGYDVSPQHDVLEQLCEAGVTCGPYHHTGLYDMLGAAVLLWVLLWLRTRWTTRHYGELFSLWMVWYGLQRFLIDFTRLDAARDGQAIRDAVMGPFTGSQWGALATAVGGVGLWALFRKTRPLVSHEQDVAYGAHDPEAPVAGDTAAGEPVAGEPAAGEPAADDPVAGDAVEPLRAEGRDIEADPETETAT